MVGSYPGLFSAPLSAVQGAEVKVCEGLLLLSRKAEGFGGRRQDGLEPGEVAVKVADVHGLFDRGQERRLEFLGQQSFPVNGLKHNTEVHTHKLKS